MSTYLYYSYVLYIPGWIVACRGLFFVVSPPFVTEVAKTKPGAREDSFGGMDHETCSSYLVIEITYMYVTDL